MKSTLRFTPLLSLLSASTTGLFLLFGSAPAQTVVRPPPAPPGSWTLIGTTVANYTIDHDAIIVRGPFDNFSKIMFKVTEAPLNMHRLVVTYENGEPDEIPVREKIHVGHMSRVIDLRGAGTRRIRRIDFWYDTRRSSGDKAEVTVFGRK